MAITEILSHTPLWVWGLLLVLITLGISAAKPGTISLAKMFILPALFFAGTVWNVFDQFSYPWWALSWFAVALITGGLIGMQLVPKQTRSARRCYKASGVRWDPQTGLIHTTGSYLTLLVILFSFIFSYLMNVRLAYEPSLHDSLLFGAISGLASGVISGIFCGISMKQLHIIRAQQAGNGGHCGRKSQNFQD